MNRRLRGTLLPFALSTALLGILPGCSLLFTAKGKTGFNPAPAQEVPQAASLSRKMSRTVVLRCKVAEGDTLGFIAGMFYKKAASGERRIALENHMGAGSALRPGRVLRIIEPDFFPNADEFKRSRQERDKAARETPKAAGPKGGPTPAGPDGADAEKDVVRVARPKVNRAFAPGEKLVYEVRIMSVLAGHASLEVDPFMRVNGRPCYPIVARATAAFPFRTLYRVDDVQASYFDAVDFLTWKFENEVHEGSYYAHNVELYDQLGHKLARRHNEEAWESLDIPPFDQDIISCFYYFRLLPLEEGRTYAIPTTSGGRNYKLLTRVVGREKVTVPAGTFDCLRLKPLVKYGTVFRNEEDIDLWVTADERHIPVRVKSAIIIGSLDVVLLEATLPDMAGAAKGKGAP